MRRILGIVLFCLVSSAAANGDLTAAEQLALRMAELDQLEAAFSQRLIDGSGMELRRTKGRLWAQRPDRFRWEVEAPFAEVLGGGPVVGMRKAHHGFQNWLEADRQVFGVRYRGHYFAGRKGEKVEHKLVDPEHPIVKGHQPFMPKGNLYNHTEIAADVTPLIINGNQGRLVPNTWIREHNGQRVFYTRYDPKDLEHEQVRELLVRALCWAAKRDQGKLRR